MRRASLFLVLFLFFLSFFVGMIQPRWYVNLTKRVDVSAQVGEQLVQQYHCRRCHLIGGEGALKAPNLDQVMQFKAESEIRLWLEAPQQVKKNTSMPNFHLSDSEVEAILAYLRSNK